MKKKFKYTDDKGELDGNWQRIPDNLPSQAEVRRAIARNDHILYKGDGKEINRPGRPIELPDLDALLTVQKKRKVTIEIDNEAIDFFKREGEKRKIGYQRIIRTLLLAYARIKDPEKSDKTIHYMSH